MLTLAQLIACGIGPSQARSFLEPLEAAFQRFDISTTLRKAAFLAQAGHESKNFTWLEENLMYSTPERLCTVYPRVFSVKPDAVPYLNAPQKLANRVYSNRLGNGDEDSGDGWRYRGRGLFQLTGRANYMAAGEALGMDLKGQPEMATNPRVAALTAGWYWATAGCNTLADTAQIDAITRKVNGPGMVGADDRRGRYERAMLWL